MTPSSRPRVDPRRYQACVLGSLLAYGLIRLDFGLPLGWIAATLGAALATQWCCGRLYQARAASLGGSLRGRPAGARDRSAARFDPWSALISGLSLCLLLRAARVEVMVAAAILAIASKFVLRWGDRHLWNPTCFAIVAMLALDLGWVSPAQWGSAVWFAVLAAGAGGLVVMRAARLDVSGGFLAAWAALLFGRALVLGDPLAIPLRQLQSGGLLIFAFHMISDPRTTPRTRSGRLLFAAAVAGGGFFVHFFLWRQDGLLWSLAAAAPLVPLLDAILDPADGGKEAAPNRSSASPASAPTFSLHPRPKETA